MGASLREFCGCLAKRLLAGGVLTGFLLPLGMVSAEVVRVGVPFSLDEEYVIASMALELVRQDYDSVGMDVFEREISSPEGQTFLDIVRLMEGDGDHQALFERSKLSPHEAPDARQKLISAYQQTFAPYLTDLKLVATYDLGDRTQFVWSVPMDEGDYVRSFTIGDESHGYKWMDSTVQHGLSNVESMIKEAEQYAAMGGALEVGNSDYRYDMDMPGSDIDLLFNGSVVRWDVFSDEHPDLPVLKMYAEAYAAFAEKDMEGFASHYTAQSALHYLDWVKAMTPVEFEAYHASVLKQREARFVLDADPIYIVFCNTAARLEYDVVVRNGDSYKLTNFYVRTYIDKILRSETAFIRPILMDVVAAGEDDIAYVSLEKPADPTPSLPPSSPTVAQNSSNAEEPTLPKVEGAPEPERNVPVFWILVAVVVGVLLLILKLILNRKTDQ